jgi:hypothetical protein
MQFNELETRCIHKLAEWHPMQTGASYGSAEELSKQLGIAEDECEPLLQTMDDQGCLTDVVGYDGTSYANFRITSRAVMLSRELNAANLAAATPDRVEGASQWARKNPIAAYALIGFGILVAVATLINQVWEIVLKFSPPKK